MRPVSELVSRVHRLLILLVMAGDGHTSTIVVQRVHRHALINIVIRDLQLACKLNIVVRKLANLNVVDAQSLLFLCSTQTERRQELANEVECAEDQTCADERVCTSSEGIGELVAELDPVVVEPTTGDDRVAVEVSNVVTKTCQRRSANPQWVYLRSKECSQNIADEATNTVDSKDVESIITAKEVLQLGGVVAGNTSNCTKDNSCPGRYVTRSRCDGDQASDDTRAEANC